jgi:hypothetical protein
VLGLGHLRVLKLARGIGATKAGLDLVLGDVKANGSHVFAKFNDQRQAHIAQAQRRCSS